MMRAVAMVSGKTRNYSLDEVTVVVFITVSMFAIDVQTVRRRHHSKLQ